MLCDNSHPTKPNARDAFTRHPDELRFLHKKLSAGPIRTQRGYPPVTDENLLSGAAKPTHQNEEVLVEASLKADPKDKNIAWTNAHFAITLSGGEVKLREDDLPSHQRRRENNGGQNL